MDNSDIHLAAIFAGAFIVGAMIGLLQKHPIPVGAIRAGLSDINHWVRNEDGEHLKAYGILSFALVVGVVWWISLL